MIEVKNLVKKYNDHIAVDDLSFTLEKGHVLGFLGPNGAGKSTTMNIMTGYLQATSGSVKINGHDIEEEPDEVKKSIGYLPEIPPLYPDMKVKEYLRFVAELKKVKKAEREKMLNEVISLIGLEDVSGRLIQHLSKGYKQRVGLAGAIMGYPDLIILDEPTVGLDPKQVIEIRELIRKLSKKHTIILSSHILSEVSAVCDEVMIINHGKLVVRDTPENLSQKNSSTNALKLKVKGAKDVVKNILQTIDSVTDVSFDDKEEAEEGVVVCTVSYKENKEIRDQISFAFADAKCPIYEMKTLTSTLEDIFIQLTQQDEKPIEEEKPKKQMPKKPEKTYDTIDDAVADGALDETEDEPVIEVELDQKSNHKEGE